MRWTVTALAVLAAVPTIDVYENKINVMEVHNMPQGQIFWVV